jgi:hypothetical protein
MVMARPTERQPFDCRMTCAENLSIIKSCTSFRYPPFHLHDDDEPSFRSCQRFDVRDRYKGKDDNGIHLLPWPKLLPHMHHFWKENQRTGGNNKPQGSLLLTTVSHPTNAPRIFKALTFPCCTRTKLFRATKKKRRDAFGTTFLRVRRRHSGRTST